VGRDGELARVREAIDRGARLVTLVGAPGAGKSRLAHRVAHLARDRRPVVVVALGSASDEGAIVAAVASALGLHLPLETDEASSADRVGHALARLGDVLVVLDELDRVVDVAARLVSAWLDAASGCALLATSREALRVTGEHRIDVGGLTEDDAAAVYEDRARAVLPSYAIDDAERTRIRALVRRLDHLPLAIELAAARVAVLRPAAMIEHLSRSMLAPLASADRDRPARHSTLTAAIDASWGLLDPGDREALAALGVFGASFDLEAAIAVLDDAHAARAVETLVERSLLRVEPDGRFAMYASVREYARAKLAGAHADAVARRFAEHFVARCTAWAEGTRTDRALACLDALARERTHLVAAHDWAGEHEPALAARAAIAATTLLATRGPPELHLALVESGLRHAKASGDGALRARARLARGEALRLRGRGDEARSELVTASEEARAAGDARCEIQALVSAAKISTWSGDLADARARLDTAIARADASGDAWAAGLARAHRAWPAVLNHRRDEARADVEHARETGDPMLDALRRRILGLACAQERRFDEAREHCAHVLATYEAHGDLVRESAVLEDLAGVEWEDGHHSEAIALYDRALDRLKRHGGAHVQQAAILSNAALAHVENGDVDRALVLLAEVHEVAPDGGGPRVSCYAHSVRAVALAPSLPDRARDELARARQHAAASDESMQRILARTDAILLAHEARRTADATIARSLLERASAATAAESLDDDEARFARILAREVGGASGGSALRITLAHDGTWLELGSGVRVDLSRRGPPRRVLCALVDLHASTPGKPIATDDLVALGWPGERILVHAARMRLHTTVRVLRELGLEGMLLTRADGYLLDPALQIARG
jgi:predicted ATPase